MFLLLLISSTTKRDNKMKVQFTDLTVYSLATLCVMSEPVLLEIINSVDKYSASTIELANRVLRSKEL